MSLKAQWISSDFEVQLLVETGSDSRGNKLTWHVLHSILDILLSTGGRYLSGLNWYNLSFCEDLLNECFILASRIVF